MFAHAANLFPVLFETLSDNSDEVVTQGLTVLAEIVNSTNSTDSKTSHSHYRKFLVSLLNLFSEKKPLLENRGTFIIRYEIRLIIYKINFEQRLRIYFS